MAENRLSQLTAEYQCKSCEAKKTAGDFYVSNLSRCKDCVKASVRSNRADKVEYYQAYDRKRYRDNPHRKDVARKSAASPAGVSARKLAAERLRDKNPQKYKARNAVNNAIRDGRIERGSECHFCAANTDLHAHHEDYDHFLDVVWLCPACHGKLHAIKGDFRRSKI